MTGRLLLLVDYRGAFWSAARNMTTTCSMDVPRLRAELTALGHDVEVRQFADLDLSRADLPGTPVFYTSSEDAGAHYKRYIESIVFGLRMRGAVPIPDPELLMAHHDKVTMEALRVVLLAGTAGQPASRTFGNFEEFAARPDAWNQWPAVLKPAAGAGSQGVSLVRDRTEFERRARRLSWTPHLREGLREIYFRLRRPGYARRSMHRGGLVIQEFVPGLTGDYKVLRYGRRFFVLGRRNRPGDFRASGGGLLDFDPGSRVDLTPVLDAALEWSDALGSPFCSLDIAHDPATRPDPALIEFQCVNFGPVTAERSGRHFRLGADGWNTIDGAVDLEQVFAAAASEHVMAHISHGT